MIKILSIFVFMFCSCGSGINKPGTKQDIINDIKSEQSQTGVTSKHETVDSSFALFWNVFKDVVKSKDQSALKDISFESLEYEHKTVSVNNFIKSHFLNVFDDTLINRMSDNTKVEFIDEGIDANYIPLAVKKQVNKEKLNVKKVNITKVEKYPEGPTIIVLEFIKTDKGYKFYGYDKFG